jgi:hypothetical protein
MSLNNIVPANLINPLSWKLCVNCGHPRDDHWGTHNTPCHHGHIEKFSITVVEGMEKTDKGLKPKTRPGEAEKKVEDCNCGEFVDNNLKWIKRHRKLSTPLAKLAKKEKEL